MDETPHDKAPVRMHEPRGQVRQYAPPPQTLPPVNVAAFSDTNETTAIDDKIPAKAQALKQQQQALVVESSKPRRGEDDDPTTLMIREEQAAKAKGKGKDGTSRGMVPAGPTPGGLKIPLPPPDTIDEAADSTRDTKSDERLSSPPVVGKSMRERNQPMPRALWIAIAVLLLVGAAAVGLYVGGVLKF
jgi:hypothetical protein